MEKVGAEDEEFFFDDDHKPARCDSLLRNPQLLKRRSVDAVRALCDSTTIIYQPVWNQYLKRIIQKQNIIRELYYTEWQFAQDMAVVVRIYLCASASLNLSATQINRLFSNVTHILDISLGILEILKRYIPKRMLEGYGAIASEDVIADDELRIGHALCLAFNGEFYREYETYICGSGAQLDLFSQLTKDNYKPTHQREKSLSKSRIGRRSILLHLQHSQPILQPAPVDKGKVTAWLVQCGKRSKKFTTAFSFESLLLKPVQRIGKYPLFLKTIISCTEEEHIDMPSLDTALTRCTHYLDKINSNIGTRA